jgi:hypothetical protein
MPFTTTTDPFVLVIVACLVVASAVVLAFVLVGVLIYEIVKLPKRIYLAIIEILEGSNHD